MSVLESPVRNRLSDQVDAISSEVDDVLAAGTESITEDEVQKLFTAAIRLYVAKRAETGSGFWPVAEHAVTATEAAVTTTSLLRAVQLELFELSMWNSLGRL